MPSSTREASGPSSTRDVARVGLAIFAAAAAGHALGLWDLAGMAPRLPSLCPVHLLTGWDCPGCGMTRAVLLLARGDVAASLHQHPFGAPLVAWAAAVALLPPLRPFRGDGVRIAAVVALLGWWIVRAVG
jgi:hypothetical protein